MSDDMKPTSPKKNQQKLKIEERREKVAELLLQGLSQRQIAKRLDVDPSTVTRDVQAILDSLQSEQQLNIDQWRTLELERLSTLCEKMAGYIDQDDSEAVMKATDRLIRISARRSRLLGLDVQNQTNAIQFQQTFIDTQKQDKIDSLEPVMTYLREVKERSENEGSTEPSDNDSIMVRVGKTAATDEERVLLLKKMIIDQALFKYPHLVDTCKYITYRLYES